MKHTALVLCPGRGKYQKAEFGILLPIYHSETLSLIDKKRRELNLPTVSELDGADKYLPALHQQPANNAALIYAAGLNQFGASISILLDAHLTTPERLGITQQRL